MPRGICRLCKEHKELVRSHFLAAAMLKTLRDPTLENPNPVAMDMTVGVQTSRQMQEHLLCAECDNRFGEQGEKWVTRNMLTPQGFPLGDAVAAGQPIVADEDGAIYPADRLTGVNIEHLVYFGLSVFWRSAVHPWRTVGNNLEPMELGPYEEPIRRFLLGTSEFPEHAVLWVVLWHGRQPIPSLLTPMQGQPCEFRSYLFYVPGIDFVLLLGQRIPDDLRACCSHRHRLIQTSTAIAKNTTDAIAFLTRVSRPSVKLLRQLAQDRKDI